MKVKELLGIKEFQNEYKKKETDFTRSRKLTFEIVFCLIMMKSVRKAYNVMRELMLEKKETTVTGSAINQARNKFKHEAFIKLNEEIIPIYYEEKEELKKWKEYFVTAVDGSSITMGYHKSLLSFFFFNKNNSVQEIKGRATIYYDVLNEIIIDSNLVSPKKGERELLFNHLEKDKAKLGEKQIIILDRGYSGYSVFKKLMEQNKIFVIRMQKGSKLVEDFLQSEKVDKTVEMFSSDNKIKKGINIRLLKIRLSTGEDEILATNLYDKSITLENFKELYFLRWGIETKYGLIKERLDLENFSGKSLEIIKQDFYSSVFISNLEVILTEDANEELEQRSIAKNNKHIYKVAKSTSYSIIKDKVWELFFDDSLNIDDLLTQLTQLFKNEPIPIRKNRKYERGDSVYCSRSYYKRRKKYVY